MEKRTYFGIVEGRAGDVDLIGPITVDDTPHHEWSREAANGEALHQVREAVRGGVLDPLDFPVEEIAKIHVVRLLKTIKPPKEGGGPARAPEEAPEAGHDPVLQRMIRAEDEALAEARNEGDRAEAYGEIHPGLIRDLDPHDHLLP